MAQPDADTLARWWVQLNAWVWPDDLPDKPTHSIGRELTEHEQRMAIRGAFVVVDQLVDHKLADALWQDRDARAALLNPGPVPSDEGGED